jgi:hypothetical protein
MHKLVFAMFVGLLRACDALVKPVKVYPLSKAGNPPEPRFIDMTDKLYNAVVTNDDSFFVSLAA